MTGCGAGMVCCTCKGHPGCVCAMRNSQIYRCVLDALDSADLTGLSVNREGWHPFFVQFLPVLLIVKRQIMSDAPKPDPGSTKANRAL
jgi:hypothetical protein